MGTPFQEMPEFAPDGYTLIGTDGKAVPLDAIVRCGRSDRAAEIRRCRFRTFVSWCLTAARAVSAVIGPSGLFALFLAALSRQLVVSYAPRYLTGGTVAWFVVGSVALSLCLRAVSRASSREGFWIGKAARTALQERSVIRASYKAAIEAARRDLREVGRVPKAVRGDVLRLGKLVSMHLDESTRYRREREKALLCVERGHLTERAAARALETLHDRISEERAVIRDAIRHADRLTIACAKDATSASWLEAERAELHARFAAYEEMASRGGRSLEAANPAANDPRYPDGHPPH